ncbi:hypothetical protein LCGC14_0736020 [marine sediment metagenome]|uniref:Uncharacterized protein n=1 Tax=marine sediment metagenome TaxID=412755 RepID=A0A0F9Q850_9ZZZZ
MAEFLHFAYVTQGVRHVACHECLPDMKWLQDMEAAGQLVRDGRTTDPCEFCGELGE